MDYIMTSISIIVPVYNVEKYLEQCIESIINQTYQDIEIICVNDGSIDSSGEILKKYQRKDKRIVIINKNNGGLSSARNEGIKVASGEYLIFVDSDDWIETDSCEKLMNYIRSNKDVQVIFYNFRFCTNKITKDFSYPLNKELRNKVKFEKVINSVLLLNYNAWNKIFKTEFIKDNNIFFNTEYNLSEDLLFSIELFAKNPNIMFTDDIIYNYRIRKDSLSRISYDEMFNVLIQMYEYVIKQSYYKGNLKFFADSLFLKMCLFIYFQFINKEDKNNLLKKVQNVLSVIRKQKNLNIFNSLFYRKLLFIVIYNNLPKSLRHKPCIY